MKTWLLPWMIIKIIKTQRAQYGRVDLNFDDKTFIIYDLRLQKEHNLIHEFLKLDGQDGGPRVDNFNQLVVFLGWRKISDVMDMLKRIIQYEDLFRLINIANPTPEEEIDLTDLIAVIRDSGWDFYEVLSHIKGSDFMDKDGHMVPEKFPEFARPIFVRGKSSAGFSFPTYFCYNASQAKIINFECWADFFKAMESVTNFRRFMSHLKLLHEKNYRWCDLWWKAHQRLNGISQPISLEESRTREPPRIKICPLCGVEVPFRAIFCNNCGQRMEWENL